MPEPWTPFEEIFIARAQQTVRRRVPSCNTSDICSLVQKLHEKHLHAYQQYDVMKSRSLRAVTTRLNELRTLKESDKITGLSCYPYAHRLIRLHDGETLGINCTSDETKAPHDGGPAAGVIRPATPTSELVSSASSKGLYVQSDPTFDFTDRELSMGEFGDAFDGRTYQTNLEKIYNSAIEAALSYDTEKEAARAKVPADTMKKVKAFAKQRYLVAHTLIKSSILEEVLKDFREERREKLGALGKDGGHATQRQKLAVPPRVQPPSGVQIQTLRRAISSTASVTGSSSATNQTLRVPPRAPGMRSLIPSINPIRP